MREKICFTLGLYFFVMLLSGVSYAETTLTPAMQALLSFYKNGAGVKAFSPEEGKALFSLKRMHSEKKEEISCTSCHMDNPAKQGKTPVGKQIDPLSPAVNKQRFTDPEKVEKWFKRNCTGVLERECTPKEKGDFISYMTSL